MADKTSATIISVKLSNDVEHKVTCLEIIIINENFNDVYTTDSQRESFCNIAIVLPKVYPSFHQACTAPIEVI